MGPRNWGTTRRPRGGVKFSCSTQFDLRVRTIKHSTQNTRTRGLLLVLVCQCRVRNHDVPDCPCIACFPDQSRGKSGAQCPRHAGRTRCLPVTAPDGRGVFNVWVMELACNVFAEGTWYARVIRGKAGRLFDFDYPLHLPLLPLDACL
jgi:hypothetical protein